MLVLDQEADGGRRLDDDVAPTASWWVPGVIVAVLAVVGIVAAVVLADRPQPTRAVASGDRQARPVAVGVLPKSTTVAPSTTGLAPADTVAPSTAAPTSVAPSSAAPTTMAPTTTAQEVLVDEVLADGWVRTGDPTGSFVVELPATPAVTSRRVRADGVVGTQVALLVGGRPVEVGITSTDRALGDRDVDAFLRDVVAVTARQLGGAAESGSSGVIGPGRYLDFRVSSDGRSPVAGRAIWGSGRLHVITTWGDEAGRGDVHERVVRTFRLR